MRTWPAVLLVLMLILPTLTAGADGGAQPTMRFPGPTHALEDAKAGSHIATHVRTDASAGQDTVVLAATNAANELAFHVLHLSGSDPARSLVVSDGLDDDGDVRYVPLRSSYFVNGWTRVDVWFHGDTYTIALDTGHTATARTFHHADVGVLVADPDDVLPGPQASVHTSRTRIDDGTTADTTFTGALGDDGWTPHATGGGLEVVPGDGGHESKGHLEVTPGLLGVAYVHTTLPDHSGVYHAEASVSAVSAPVNPPDGLAVLAGVRGDLDDPEVVWAVEVAGPVTSGQPWAFRVVLPGRAVTLSPTYGDGGWHAVRVTVDEPLGAITVSLDGGIRQTFHATRAMAASDRVAVGDVTAAPSHRVNHAIARVDDLAVYDAPATPVASAPGHHLTVNVAAYRRDTPILEARDDAGALVAALRTHLGALYASTPTADGGVAWVQVHDDIYWYTRLDLVLHGATYDVTVDQGPPTTLGTLAPATEARLAVDGVGWDDDSVGSWERPVRWRDARVDAGDGTLEASFARPLGATGWSIFNTTARVDVETGYVGRFNDGRLEVSSAWGNGLTSGDTGLGYLHAPLAGLDGRYVAEAAVRLDTSLVPPDGHAVLAGLSGPLADPTVNWAVLVMRSDLGHRDELAAYDRDVAVDEHALYLWTPDGGTTPLVRPMWSTPWRHVVVDVDEVTGTLAVALDGGEARTFAGSFPASDRVAVGDVFHAPGAFTGYGAAQYDDVAVYPPAVP